MPQRQHPAVLLVDDDAATNYNNQRLLQRLPGSPEVLVASNADDALAVLHARCAHPGTAACPTLILLDLNLPPRNGFEFLRAFARRHPTLPQSFVVVLLTALPLDPGLVEDQHLPVTAMLTKPLTAEAVNHLLYNYFDVPTLT
ncbi:response regulator receiver protein [Hymenobacter roseosalivarius DSM 11622]|uniref:Response regulator receiver protein n=1 Tax=Hymenobacter roseosalivarius DSM 11622 TaxID=645990 RepID=A0A1W1W235_9BACT|nr:response regulator [Hymenobacter roseosalivarius]SMB99685.1 response regulator receiver protein [Hymenobacter roseosalivarius DSM 11622]